jgi:adenylate cyclase
MLSSNREDGQLKRAARNAAIVGLAAAGIGVLGSLVPQILLREESLGLSALYAVRGYENPPANVIIVALTRDSAEALGLTEALEAQRELKGWPRSLHADLIEALDAAGVAQIVFDLYFGAEQTPDDDAIFANAIRSSGKVILFDSIERSVDPPEDNLPALPFEGIGHKHRPPLQALDAAARATAPFLLPTRPFKTGQYWPFLDIANDAPTLPIVAFALASQRAQSLVVQRLIELRPELGPKLRAAGISEQMRAIRQALRTDKATARTLGDRLNSTEADDSVISAARTLVDLYAGPDSRYLRFYGPPRTITTVPVDDILLGRPDPTIHWRGATVFVGFSDRTQPDQADEFLSVYSQPSGLDVSGVEFAATAFANLVESKSLMPLALGPQLGLLLVLGLLLGAAFALRTVRAAVAVLALVLGLYLLAASFEFNTAGSWWPVVVPALMQAPVALVLGLWLRYFSAEKSRAAVSRGASLYLPAELVDRIAEDPEAATRSSELVTGPCMVTDIESYTAYAEKLSPKQLEGALNAYYDTLFEIIDDNGGLVTDIVGDSMVAVWRDGAQQTHASVGPLRAAFDIGARLTASSPPFARTRVGLTAGEFVLGTVGAQAHREYRAVGDTVNSAARIQVLNKRLGTTVLCTRVALPERDVYFRELGSFQLTGKRNVLEICEPVSIGKSPDPSRALLVERFEAALDHFRRGDWSTAVRSFEAILAEFGDDGPTDFYIQHIRSRLEASASAPLDTVIRLTG